MIRAPFKAVAAATIVIAAIAGVLRPLSAQDTATTQKWPGHFPWTQADVQFVSGMIGHHAQAIVMAKWAPTHGANESVKVLCARIINAQTDEILIMQNWLKARNQPVPEAVAGPMKMMMNGVEHTMLMPGMLSDEQLKQLDAARGKEFDHLFLRFMIQHHNGAITMVNELFASPGAGQDEQVFKMANDIQADQGTEINRMTKMLLTMPGE